MKFIRNFLRAWRIATQELEFAPEYESFNAWTEEDRRTMLAFVNTESGTKLMKRLTNSVFKSAIEATQAERDHKRKLGIARGVALTVGSIQSHIFASPNVRNTRPSVMQQPTRDAAVS